MIFIIFLLAYNWRDLSDALGHGIGRKRKQQKRQSKSAHLIVWMGTWLIAVMFLLERCGGLFCNAPPNANLSHVEDLVTGTGPGPGIPYAQTFSQLGSIVQINWFSTVFLGFLVVSSAIIIRALKVSWDETKSDMISFQGPQVERMMAVEDAIHILESQKAKDPRTRIIDCYQRMVQAAQHLGAPVTPDQTARELGTAVRKMLMLHGSAIDRLTDLFEEARYSLHSITEKDAERAHELLFTIADEMKLPASV